VSEPSGRVIPSAADLSKHHTSEASVQAQHNESDERRWEMAGERSEEEHIERSEKALPTRIPITIL
jgi:hypothetical protein